MGNLYSTISGRPFDQKEWDKKMATAEKKFRKDHHKKKWQTVFVEITYGCVKCKGRFYFDDPCEHTEQQRQENMKKFLDDMAEDTPAQLEKKMWGIAERLLSIPHEQIQKHFFPDEEEL
jgi:hypothetical protein